MKTGVLLYVCAIAMGGYGGACVAGYQLEGQPLWPALASFAVCLVLWFTGITLIHRALQPNSNQPRSN